MDKYRFCEMLGVHPRFAPAPEPKIKMVGTDFWPTPRRIFTFLHIYAKDAELRRRARKFYNWDANGVTECHVLHCFLTALPTTTMLSGEPEPGALVVS